MHFRALVRRAPPRRAGTTVMAAPVIMQPQFQQSVRPLLSCRAVLPDIMVGMGYVSAHLWQFHSCSSWTKWLTFLSWRRCRFHVLTVQNYRDFSLQYIDQVIGVGFAIRAVPRSVLEETVVLFFVDVPVVPDFWHSSSTLWTSL